MKAVKVMKQTMKLFSSFNVSGNVSAGIQRILLKYGTIQHHPV
jgi:hypothetical protein